MGRDPDGFHDGVFDGRHVYFVPYHNGTTYSGEVLRFDAGREFTDPGAWDTCDPGAQGVGNHPNGYHGAVFDGQFVYFVPNYNNTGNHSEVLRLDTAGDFSNASSWTTFDPGDQGVGEEAGGYHRGAFDGRFVYFAPAGWQPAHGEVLRHDTAGCRGDLNCDGALNAFDIDPFVLALTDPAGYAAVWPECNLILADCNAVGVVDAFDIDPFVGLLIGG